MYFTDPLTTKRQEMWGGRARVGERAKAGGRRCLLVYHLLHPLSERSNVGTQLSGKPWDWDRAGVLVETVALDLRPRDVSARVSPLVSAPCHPLRWSDLARQRSAFVGVTMNVGGYMYVLCHRGRSPRLRHL